MLAVGAERACAEESRAGKSAPSKRTIVRFDDDMIQGDLTRPDGDLVAARPELQWPSLIEPPSSFARAAQRTLLAAAAAVAAMDAPAERAPTRRQESRGGAGRL